jgi:hypothetical protein
MKLCSSSPALKNNLFFARSSPFSPSFSPARLFLCKTEKNPNIRAYGGRQFQVGGNGGEGGGRNGKKIKSVFNLN